MLNFKKEPFVDLKKKAEQAAARHNLFGKKAEVKFVLDRSFSMDDLYRSGQVQLVSERCLALATQFDDDGQVPVYVFHDRAYRVGEMTMANYPDFVKKHVETIAPSGTRYAPPMHMVVEDYDKGTRKKAPGIGGFFGKTTPGDGPPAIPTYVLYLTDGQNDDRRETEAIIRASERKAIFWQFVGIGRGPFPFLEKLDDLKDRFEDSVDFFHFYGRDLTDEELYEGCLKEFAPWYRRAKQKGILA